MTNKHRPRNTQTKEVELFILGYISRIFKEDMIDPIGKNPTLIKTILRIFEFIHTYFNDTNLSV